MTDGLAILGAWVEFALLIAAFLYFVLGRGTDDPSRESRRSVPDSDSDGGGGSS
jgi:hypothetical protein